MRMSLMVMPFAAIAAAMFENFAVGMIAFAL